jgi:hypothetical protein
MADAEFFDAFDELCAKGVVDQGVPSTIVALESFWPLGRQGRPMAHEWRAMRASVFARDDYTCRYCSARGVRLECDHVVPVSKGGPSIESNLVTACFPCNRSKRDKSLSVWKAA